MKELTHQSKQTSLNYVELRANGSPLLLLHGATNQWRAFEPVLSHLEMHSHVYALDFRGHGNSSRPGSYTMKDYREDTHSFISSRIQKAPVIFGHSLGGMLAIMLAVHYPEWVRGIVIGDAPLSLQRLHNSILNQRDIAYRIVHLLKNKLFDQLRSEVKDSVFVENLIKCDPEMILAMQDRFEETFGEYQIEKVLPQVKCPVLVLRGNPQLGSMISDEDFAKAQELLPTISVLQIQDTGHSLFTKDNALLLSVLGNFLKNLE